MRAARQWTCLAAVVCACLAIAQPRAASTVHLDLQNYFASQVEPSLAGANQFTFGVTGDIHLSHGATFVLTRDEWQNLLTRWRDAGYLFGVVVGDLGYGAAQDVDDVVSGQAAVAGAPRLFFSMGNHETDDPAGKRLWIDNLYPGVVQPGSWSTTVATAGDSDRAYWSFNVGAFWHFVMLDADIIRAADGGDYGDTIGLEQQQWLASDLQANRGRNVMVFVHEPIDQARYDTPEYTLTDRGPLTDLLATHPKPVFVFSGHLHGYRGITKWKGITSVHTSDADPTNTQGVTVSIDGDVATVGWAGMTASDTVDYDHAPMYAVQDIGGTSTLPVAEDGLDSGQTRNQQMAIVGSTGGVDPTTGSMMLMAGPVNWYNSWFISEQLVKIVPGMKFSYDIRLSNVAGGLDAVGVQPNWVMAGGGQPPVVTDQNGIPLSTRTRDGYYNTYFSDLPSLQGRATDQWYHRVVDLTPMAGNYADGVVLGTRALGATVDAVYVDNITFTWPTVPCVGSLATASQSFTSTDGSATLAVTTAPECAWAATSGASWITITGGAPTTGSGVVAFAVSSNPTTTPRSGTLTIAGQSFTVTQAGIPLTATITYPANGASNADLTVPIQWTTVQNAQAYYLYVGSTPGAKDLLNSGELQATQLTASSLPGGRTLYARLWTKVGGVWRSTDSTFTATVQTPLTATLTSPANGATNVDLTVTLQWTSVANAQAYYLYGGTSVGAKDVVNTGEVQSVSYTAANLPAGSTVYARLWTKVAGVWRYSDSTFTTTSPVTATLTYPVNGTRNADLTQSIRWTTVAGAQAYYLYVGSAVGAKDIVNTGETQSTSYLAASVPAGPTLYARLWTKVAGVWRSVDSTFTAAPSAPLAATLTYPANGASGVDITVPLQWTPISGAQAYYLYVGSTAGAKDLVNTGEIQSTSYSAQNLPAGHVLYVRLWTKVAGTWRYTDSTFTPR